VLRRHASWLLPALIALAVLAAGARLIELSVQEHTGQMRLNARATAARHAASIQRELQAFARRTQDHAAHALAPTSGATFWMDAHGKVVRASQLDTARANAIAGEWLSAGASTTGAMATPSFFGPVRYGSQWIVAAAAPMRSDEAQQSGGPALWVVGFEELDALLARAHFGTLVDEGYDFQLYQPDPSSGRPRAFVASQPALNWHPVVSAISAPGAAPQRAPAASSGALRPTAADFLVLALQPRGGWYPARELATEIGLLALIAWALTFGMYDLTHALERTRGVLDATRQRLHFANERLAGEIEQRQSLQRSFEHARYHDTFTGLPNRRYFMDQLDRALRDVRTRRRQRIAIVLLDIERFRLISDTLGHTAGDELLLQAAQRCAQVLGGVEHLLARWGAEQLAVLLYDVASLGAAQEVADSLQEVRREPFELRQHRISVTSRVGFSCIDSGLQRAEEALREADLALSVACQHQSARAVPYAPGMGGAAVSLVSLEADLHVALDRNEFRLLYQPIVDLRSQRMVGAEALLRWRHPVEGLLTPDRFLAIAEEAGVIVPVTRWIIQRVCRLAAEWRQRLPQGVNFFISVNLSAAVLRSPGLREFVAEALRDTHIPAENLKFELSEGGIVSNVTTARAVLDALHDIGIELMLDDFGTGYSSLSYLQLFPFDYVKIDRPFVSRTGSERANNAIVSAILQMASSLGLRSIAEIVETRTAAQTLSDMGCDFGQGYYFCAPVEAEEAFLQLRNGKVVAAGTETAGAREILQSAKAAGAADDSPTLVLPPGVIIESRIKDESDEPEEQGSTT
jgi:diguanylate cyclase (GGDEF)-like protein